MMDGRGEGSVRGREGEKEGSFERHRHGRGGEGGIICLVEGGKRRKEEEEGRGGKKEM